MSTVPTSLARFVDEAEPSETSLFLLNRSRPVEVASLLDRAFADQSVGVADVSLPAGPDDVVCLVEDGRVAAATPLSRLEETFLLVNSDRYPERRRRRADGRRVTRRHGPRRVPRLVGGAFAPPGEDGGAALVAVETGDNRRRGTWTTSRPASSGSGRTSTVGSDSLRRGRLLAQRPRQHSSHAAPEPL
jgi:hypothetical protein